MGQKASVLEVCLTGAVGPANVAFPSKPLYLLKDVKRYNLDIEVRPIAVTYPDTNAKVAAIVKCASDFGAKVQAKSGGHGYGNFGISAFN